MVDSFARAVFGGTFDPIHNGHLRTAVEAQQALDVPLFLMPCHQPVHRDSPMSSASQRLSMLRLAVQRLADVDIDARELQKDEPSYSYNSFVEIRAEIGSEAPLFLLMGIDTFAKFDQWYRWRELTEICHLVVLGRPGFSPELNEELDRLLAQREDSIQALSSRPGGGLARLNLTPWDISSTEIRRRIVANVSVDGLLPESVMSYIREHHLYREECMTQKDNDGSR